MPVDGRTTPLPKAIEQRVGQRCHIAVRIDRREMAGAGARLGDPPDAPLVAAPGPVQPVGVDFPAFGIGPASGIGRAAGIEMTGDVIERFDQPGAAAGRACGVQIDAPMRADQRVAFDDLIGGEIVRGDPAAAGFEVGRDPQGQLAAVEIIRPVFGKRAQGLGQSAERKIAFGLRRHAARQVKARRLVVAAQIRHRQRHLQHREPAHRQAAVGKSDRRAEQPVEAEPPQARRRARETPDGAGHGDRPVADLVPPIGHARKAHDALGHGRIEGIVIAADRRRQHALKVEDMRALLGGDPDHQIARAAEPAHPGLDHAERKGGRDRGVDRIAAFRQHPGPRPRRQDMLGGDHAGLGRHRPLGDGPLLDIGVHPLPSRFEIPGQHVEHRRRAVNAGRHVS